MRFHCLWRNVAMVVGLCGASLLLALVCPATNEMGSQQPAALAAPPGRPQTARLPQNGAAPAGESGPTSKRPKIDPIQANGRFFQGWTKPRLALVVSGRQDGYLEPCGCAGLENQKGGLGRRHALVKDLAARDWPLAAVDVGGLVRRFGKQAEIELAVSAEAYRKIGYSAVGFGPADLRLPAGEVLAAVAGPDPDKSIFICANASLLGLTPKTQIVRAGGLKLGITAVLGDGYQKQINNPDIETRPAAAALREVVGQLKDCDHRILLAHATMAETEALARQFPQFDLVVTADGADEPPNLLATISGTSTRLVEVGHKGMYVVVLGLYDKQKVRYQRVALDARYAATDAMHKLQASYQEELKQLGWKGLEIRPASHPAARAGSKSKLAGRFAGAASCQDCHADECEISSQSKHAHATETLVHLDPPRHFDPQCVSCHVTGWNPQEYTPFVSGYESLEKTPRLLGVQCENCHGPGAAHVEAENGDDEALQEKERAPLKLTLATAREGVCLKCHDLDNSPEFHKEGAFEAYWKKIKH